MDTRASPSPAASSASRSKPAASSSSSNNASLRPQGSMPQSHILASGAATSSRSPRKPTANAAASSSKGVVEEAKPTRNSSNSSLKAKAPKIVEDTHKPTKNDELVQAFRSDLDSLRALLTCKICDRLLYEPYTVACGHIYCYSCLSQWFSSNKRKTCPDCRAAVTQIPASTYLIREMIQIFINRAENLPAGETLEQHAAWQKEEAEAVKKDRENTDSKTGGLFKGVFTHRPVRYAMQDSEDGVERCPLCGWELEGGGCDRCGLSFDENGMAIDASVGDFSDEISDQGLSSEDFDAEMDVEDYPDDGDYPGEIDFDAFGEQWGDEWDPAFDDDPGFAVRRWLAHGGHRHYGIGPRRRAAHSAAGSRRRYSASLTSDVITEDMETLEEEDEDDMDEDSSMNDFIDDGQTEDGSQITTSTASQTPQPRSNRRSQQRRNRRIVESETSSSVSQATEDDDDDEDPVRPGRRRQQPQNRTLARANGARRAASSTSTEMSAGHELEEDTEALLHAAGWEPLVHDRPDEMDEDEDSDGGRTTVGWEPTANSNNRVSVAISLTTAADRPSRQSRQQPSGGRRFPDGSRGLRHRGSVLSVSTVQYEDEADDDDSEMDRDGDTNMSGSVNLRPRTSRTRLREQAQRNGVFSNRGLSANDAIDLDTDDNSDTSIVPTRRANARARQREYDPRISLLFANHQVILRELDFPESFRSTTPLARPRTANRNRISVQSPVAHPASPASRAFPPMQGGDPRASSTPTSATTLNPSSRRGSVDVSVAQTVTASSRSERSASISSNAPLAESTSSENGVRLDREASVESANSSSTVTMIAPAAGQTGTHGVSQSITSGPTDIIDRPMSRLNARPPSATGRRSSGGYVINQGFPMPQAVGLNFAQRTAWQAQTRNPYLPFIPMTSTAPRPRQSRQTLREQASTATIRPRNSQRTLRQQPSRADIQDGTSQNPVMRQPPAQYNLRPQPSARRLNSQSSSRTLRAAHVLPGSSTVMTNVSAGSSRLSEDERRRRVDEVIRSRVEVLRTNNPFAGRHQGSMSGAGFASNINQPGVRPEGVGTNPANTQPSSSAPAQHPSTAGTNTTPTSPGLNRRRSNRSIGLPPGAFVNVQHPGFMRTRSGQMYGASPDTQSIPTTQHRATAPVATASYAT